MEIEKLAGAAVSEVIEVPSHIDRQSPLEPQIACRLDNLGLGFREWQTEPIIINLPSLNYSAAVVLAMLHGRIGHFPPVLRLVPETKGIATRFKVVEILNLQFIRERAREIR